MLGYMPTAVRLLQGWYSVHFLSQDDLVKIKVILWINDRSFWALHSWYIGFNPLKDMPQNNLIWVKLPGLPIELWTK